MAATGWTYYCPYDSDAEAALQQLRKDVFERREYTLPSDLMQEMDDEVLKKIKLRTPDLKRMVNAGERIQQALNQHFASLGYEMVDDDKETKEMKKFIENIEKDGAESAVRHVIPSPKKQLPTSIDMAREIAAESGTHSILDIDHVADTPGFGIAVPLSNEELMTLFGTTEPSLEMVKLAENNEKLISFRECWEAVCFPVYSDGIPEQYVFAGRSGD